MRTQFRLACCCLGLAFVISHSGQSSASDPIPGVGPLSEVRKLHSNFQFTEGPASDRDGKLYFTDIPANRIYRVDLDESLTVAVEPSNHANGLMIDGAGHLVVCEMDGSLAARDLTNGERKVLSALFEGKRFNAPNDLVIDQRGGVYFTDPRFRAPDPWPQGKEAFYYRTPNGVVHRLGDELKAPNGIILSPDGQTLYVVPSLQNEMMAYPVRPNGQIGVGRVFCSLAQPDGTDSSGGDGLTIDTQGNLYITSRLGIQVYSPRGDRLGMIEFPEQPANVTFGGKDRKTLYVTARTSLYAATMEAQGHVFGGSLKW